MDYEKNLDTKHLNYEEMSNMEINAIHIQMHEEYEAIKTQILQLLSKMDKMDIEFAKGKVVLNKRLQR